MKSAAPRHQDGRARRDERRGGNHPRQGRRHHSAPGWFPMPWPPPRNFELDGRQWSIQLRPARYYKPYSLTLLDFTHEVYPGTQIPKNFSSKVTLADPENERSPPGADLHEPSAALSRRHLLSIRLRAGQQRHRAAGGPQSELSGALRRLRDRVPRPDLSSSPSTSPASPAGSSQPPRHETLHSLSRPARRRPVARLVMDRIPSPSRTTSTCGPSAACRCWSAAASSRSTPWRAIRCSSCAASRRCACQTAAKWSASRWLADVLFNRAGGRHLSGLCHRQPGGARHVRLAAGGQALLHLRRTPAAHLPKIDEEGQTRREDGSRETHAVPNRHLQPAQLAVSLSATQEQHPAGRRHRTSARKSTPMPRPSPRVPPRSNKAPTPLDKDQLALLRTSVARYESQAQVRLHARRGAARRRPGRRLADHRRRPDPGGIAANHSRLRRRLRRHGRRLPRRRSRHLRPGGQ